MVYCSYGLYQGCNYVRLWLPQKYNGWAGDYIDIRREQRRSPGEATMLILKSDIVVMQRPFEQQRMVVADIVKRVGKKLVFDNDDTYQSVPNVMKKHSAIIDQNLKWFIGRADLVTCTTPFLKQEYEQLNDRVQILPNMIDPDDWPEPEPEPEEGADDEFRVGLVGSVTYDDAKAYWNDLERLAGTKGVRLVVMGDRNDRDRWSKIGCEYHGFVPVWEYPTALRNLKLDVMIIPREDNYFNRCKSPIKFYEASVLGIPVLAQGFSDGASPYQQNPEDAKHMIIVYGNWYDAVMEARGNRDFLRKMAGRAREYVLKNYNIKDKYHLWKKTYQTII